MLQCEKDVSHFSHISREHGYIRSVSVLQVLVETVPLGDELLFPLPEPSLLLLDLLGEPLPQILLLLLELGVIELPRTSLTELASLHLLRTVGLVVLLFGGVDQVQHMSADQDAPQLLEIAVVLVLDLGDSPGILAALDDTTVRGLDVLLTTNDSEWHGGLYRSSLGAVQYTLSEDALRTIKLRACWAAASSSSSTGGW